MCDFSVCFLSHLDMILSYSNMYLNLTEGFTVVETQIV